MLTSIALVILWICLLLVALTICEWIPDLKVDRDSKMIVQLIIVGVWLALTMVYIAFGGAGIVCSAVVIPIVLLIFE